MLLPIARAHRGGWFDSLEVDRTGLVRLMGWTRGDINELLAATISLDDEVYRPSSFHRVFRPDVAGQGDSFSGFVLEYLLRPRSSGQADFRVTYENSDLLVGPADLSSIPPDYSGLLNELRVLHRADIYGYGPPTTEVSEEVYALVRSMPGPILDFGCGGGALMRRLRGDNHRVLGLELDRAEIRTALSDEVRPLITLYGGTLPTPFADGAFSSVVLVEVLEHVADFDATLTEVVRLASAEVLVTVPDMSAIPIGFHHHVVPWHLLESTHVNFFTAHSLAATLHQHFRSVEMAKIGAFNLNGSLFFTSLAARCRI